MVCGLSHKAKPQVYTLNPKSDVTLQKWRDTIIGYAYDQETLGSIPITCGFFSNFFGIITSQFFPDFLCDKLQ